MAAATIKKIITFADTVQNKQHNLPYQYKSILIVCSPISVGPKLKPDVN